jgi:2-polyprenyl-6-hydroxyphenyl methylase/3-demethylubiquinone-9 3-methyltransferase
MNATKTDRLSSLAATEYVWDRDGATEVHSYVWPVLSKILIGMPSKELLDLGCGNGSLTVRLAELGLKCTGTDFSGTGIQIAQNSYPKVAFFQSGMDQSLPVNKHKSFDVVIAVEVIEHLLLPRQLFERAKEALKEGGILIVTTPYHGYFKNLALALVNKYDSHWHPLRDYGHIKFFSKKTLRAIFNESGFICTDFYCVGRIPVLARSMIMVGKLKT